MSLLTKNLIEHLAGFDDLTGCIKLVLGITGAFSPRTLNCSLLAPGRVLPDRDGGGGACWTGHSILIIDLYHLLNDSVRVKTPLSLDLSAVLSDSSSDFLQNFLT